jgi:hypothetical protein
MGWIKRLFGGAEASTPAERAGNETAPKHLAPVAGALAASHEGRVVYNMLTPHMQQFMGRCIAETKKAGMQAKGTGQFSMVVNGSAEVKLSGFYQPQDDPRIVQEVVAAARRALQRS